MVEEGCARLPRAKAPGHMGQRWSPLVKIISPGLTLSQLLPNWQLLLTEQQEEGQ